MYEEILQKKQFNHYIFCGLKYFFKEVYSKNRFLIILKIILRQNDFSRLKKVIALKCLSFIIILKQDLGNKIEVQVRGITRGRSSIVNKNDEYIRGSTVIIPELENLKVKKINRPQHSLQNSIKGFNVI